MNKQHHCSYASLKQHLSNCPLYISTGIRPSTSKIILVAKEEYLKSAILYVQTQCPNAKLTGIVLYPNKPELHGKTCYISDQQNNHSQTIFIPLSTIQDFPEAKILVFLDEPHTPWPSSDFYQLFYQLSQQCKSFAIYPEIPNNIWLSYQFPDFYRKNAATLEELYKNLEDYESKVALASLIKAIISGELGYIHLADFEQYDHPATRIQQGDFAIYAGIYANMAPLLHYSKMVGSQGAVYGFEPEPDNYFPLEKQLKKNATEYNNIQIFNQGLYSEPADLLFNAAGPGSSITTEVTDSTSTRSFTSIDSFVLTHNIPKINLITLDVEGAEEACIHGAKETLLKWKPRLIISAYHNTYKDILTIGRAIHQYVPEYKFYFANHFANLSEFVLYATVQ